ncbi:hypothetical protein L6R53_05935 [Myxococcota bacterium]|nr:hypothetical protein [Myxococcota bacterium]
MSSLPLALDELPSPPSPRSAPEPVAPTDPRGLLEALLRDGAGLSRALVDGPGAAAAVPALALLAAGGAALFGLAIGVQGGLAQALVSGVKLPLIVLGSAASTLPVLHVSCAQAGRALAPERLSALVLQAVATATVTMAGLAPLAVVTWLTFSLGGDGGGHEGTDAAFYAYRRLVLATVAVGGVGGLVGALRLWRVLPVRATLPWIAALGLVGLQLSWLLRPVIGMPGRLVVLRPVQGSGLHEVLSALAAVLGV